MLRLLPSVLLVGLFVLVTTLSGCGSSSGYKVRSTYYGGSFHHRYYRPVYVPIGPDLPDEPIAVPLPEPDPGLPDFGPPDIDMGGLDW